MESKNQTLKKYFPTSGSTAKIFENYLEDGIDNENHDLVIQLFQTRDKLLHEMELLGRSKTTIKNYYSTINKFIAFIYQSNYTDLGADNVDEVIFNYISYLKANGNRNFNSLNQYLREISVFLKELNLTIKAKKVKADSSNGEVNNQNLDLESKALTTGEISLIIQSIQDLNTNPKIVNRDTAIIKTLFNTGSRVSELTALNIDDINLRYDSKVEIKIKHGKGNKLRYVGINRDTYNALLTMINDRPDKVKADSKGTPLFLNYTNNRLNSRTIQKSIKKYGDNVKIITKTITPHTFRHSLAVYLLNEKHYDINEVQKILGHSSVETTGKYLTVNKERAIEILNEVDLNL